MLITGAMAVTLTRSSIANLTAAYRDAVFKHTLRENKKHDLHIVKPPGMTFGDNWTKVSVRSDSA